MPTCPYRERLMNQYHDAVLIFSSSIRTLKGCNRDGHGFAEAHQATGEARLHAENARTMLNLHREEHGC